MSKNCICFRVTTKGQKPFVQMRSGFAALLRAPANYQQKLSCEWKRSHHKWFSLEEHPLFLKMPVTVNGRNNVPPQCVCASSRCLKVVLKESNRSHFVPRTVVKICACCFDFPIKIRPHTVRQLFFRAAHVWGWRSLNAALTETISVAKHHN